MTVVETDVAVVGVGSVGSMASWQLASRGLRVVGIDRFTIPGPFSAYAGESRVFRMVYAEGGHYTPLLQLLMGAVAEDELSVILSSHLIADLERVCDYLIVLAGSRVQVAGPIDKLRATHHLLTGPRRGRGQPLPTGLELITESHTDVQSTLLVKHNGPVLDPAWSVCDVSLEDLVLAYIGRDTHRTAAAHTLRMAS